MSGEGTYAPKSPDLSSLFAGPAPAANNNNDASAQAFYQTQAQDYQLQGRSNQQQGLHLQPPPQSYYQQTPLSPSGGLGGGHPQVQQQPHQHQPLSDPYSPRRQAQQQPPLQQYYTPTSPQQAPHQSQPGFGLQQPPPYYQPPYAEQGYPYSAPAQSYSQPQYYNPLASQTPSLQPPADVQPHQEYHQQQQPGDISAMPPRRAAAAPQPPVIEPSPVKTKFPTARIKRIMQADEEVGKVAQQTPIAVGKALELFMIALVTKSADVAKEKNSKRVTAQMLKHVVESDDQWDFLRDIVGRVENEDKAKSGGRAKAESSSDEEAVESKKKVKGGRKKKA